MRLTGPTLLTSVTRESGPLALIALWFVAVAIASGIWWDVPLIDDWTYAWSVERLLATGRFEVLDWSGNFTIGQVVWGAAWSSVMGFSFVTLRLSTLVLGLIACAALYVMLRDFNVPRGVALAGALTLAVNPVFAVLSASFMTDVPFTSCATLSLLCYTRAAQFGRPHHLWWAGFWAFAAFTVRQVGIVVPLAGVPLFLTRARPHTFRPIMVAAVLGTTWSAMIGLWLTLEAFVGSTSIMERWVGRLQHLFLVRPLSYLAYNVDLLMVLAFFLLPTLLAATAIRGIWRSRVLVGSSFVALVILLANFGELPIPLAPSETWNLREIGGSRALVSGSMPPEPRWMKLPVRLAGLLAFTLLIALLFQSLEPMRRAAVGLAKAGRNAALSFASAHGAPSATPLLAFAVGYVGIINLFWLYNDRYYLALMPPLITLVLVGLPETRVVTRLAWVTVGVFAVTALVGSRDAFRFNMAVRQSWQTLVNAGVAPSDIDAGYAWNGWILYAHPENLAKGLTPLLDVPWINSARLSKYALSKTSGNGYEVERTILWKDLPWPGPDRLLVLRRQSDTGEN